MGGLELIPVCQCGVLMEMCGSGYKCTNCDVVSVEEQMGMKRIETIRDRNYKLEMQSRQREWYE